MRSSGASYESCEALLPYSPTDGIFNHRNELADMIYSVRELCSHLTTASEKRMTLPFVRTMLTIVYSLLLFIFILFYSCMKIKSAFNQQFCWLAIMIIP